MGSRLYYEFGEVYVATVLDNFTIHQLRNFGERIIRWPIQLVRFAGSCIIMQHRFEGVTDVNGLQPGISKRRSFHAQ